MSPRSSVFNLDPATRAELDRRIIAAGFGRYAEHAEWLAMSGHTLSVAALHRYGKNLRGSAERNDALVNEQTAAAIARIRHTKEMAQAILDAAGDDPLDMSERTAELCLARLYRIAADDDIDARTLQTISRSLNDNLRAVAAVRTEHDETRREALAEAQRVVMDEGKRQGLSDDTAAAIRAAIQGTADNPTAT